MLIVLSAVSHLSGGTVLVASTFLVVFGLGPLYPRILPATTVLLRETTSADSSLIFERILASVVTAVAFGALGVRGIFWRRTGHTSSQLSKAFR